jgi:hypothetical protein
MISRNFLILYFVICTALVKGDNEESIIKYIVSQKIWNVLLECSSIHINVTCPNMCQYSYCGNLFNAVCLFFVFFLHPR